MTAKSISDLNTQTATLAPDNTSGEISPADLRTMLTDLADSSYNNVTNADSAAAFLAGTADKVLVADSVWSAGAEVTLTDAATIAVDMSTFINATVTLGGNRTLGNPTNPKPGQTGYIRVVQDGTGGRTLSFASNYEFKGGTAPTLSTAASKQDMLFYVVISSTRILITSVLDIS